MEEIQKFVDQMKEIQKNLISFIDDEAGGEDNFGILSEILKNSDFCDNKYKFKPLLYLISRILTNHHRVPQYYKKIKKILGLIKDSIKKLLENSEIFDIFKYDKLVLLCLIENKIMVLDKPIFKIISKESFYKSNNYLDYFLPEIKRLNCARNLPGNLIYKNLSDEFYEKRENGENDDLICQFIQKDSIVEFISYVKKNNISLNQRIQSSIYETNYFLNTEHYDLIEYSCFYGSIQVFNYLKINGVKLTPKLWYFAIRGQNPEIIHILEENHVQLIKSYLDLLEKTIECFSNDIAHYILNTNLAAFNADKISIKPAILSHNYEFINSELVNGNVFQQLCQADNSLLIELLMKDKNINADFGGALFESIKSNKIDFVKLLLTSNKLNINSAYTI